MSGAISIPLEQRVLALAVLASFLFWVFRLVRTQRLSLRDSLLWVVSTLLAAGLVIFPALLAWATSLLGFQTPSNAIYGAAVLYLAVNVVFNTVAISMNAARLRRLTQECALLRAEIEALRASRHDGEPSR